MCGCVCLAFLMSCNIQALTCDRSMNVRWPEEDSTARRREKGARVDVPLVLWCCSHASFNALHMLFPLRVTAQERRLSKRESGVLDLKCTS